MRIDAHPMRIGRCIRMANPTAYVLYMKYITLHIEKLPRYIAF